MLMNFKSSNGEIFYRLTMIFGNYINENETFFCLFMYRIRLTYRILDWSNQFLGYVIALISANHHVMP